MRWVRFLVTAAIFFASAAPCCAESFSIWVSPLKAREVWRTVRPAPVMTLQQGSPSTTLLMSTSNITRPIFVDIPLVVPENLLIESVTICYQVSNTATAIDQIDLLEMQTPDFNYVDFDPFVNLSSTSATCYTAFMADDDQIPFSTQGTLTLSLRLNFADVSHTIELGGIALHGVRLTTDAPTPPAAAGVQLDQNVPNPFTSKTRIEYVLANAGKVTIGIFDVSGRRVRSFEFGSMPAGRHTLMWNGTDDSGGSVPPGTYFYRARLNGEVVSRSLTLRR